MANRDLKLYMAGKGIRQWQLARKAGYTAQYFSALLREELTEDKKAEYRNYIDELAAQEDDTTSNAQTTA